jgi:hypothetical protein
MTPHHVYLYSWVMEKNEENHPEIHPDEDHHQPGSYEIRIQGHLDDQWADWFGGLRVTLEDNGDTLLTGPVVDQAALHGLLRKVRDLGMPLISVRGLEPGQTDAPDV